MGRPAIKEENKRGQISISVPKELLEIASTSENSSRFFEKSAFLAMSMVSLLEKLRNNTIEADEFQEDMEDIVDSWNAQFEEAIDFDQIKRTIR